MENQLSQYLGKEVFISASHTTGQAVLENVLDRGIIVSSKQGGFTNRFIPWSTLLYVDLVMNRSSQTRVA